MCEAMCDMCKAEEGLTQLAKEGTGTIVRGREEGIWKDGGDGTGKEGTKKANEME